MPLYRENLYYSLRSKSIARSVSVYITKADCEGHMCSISSMNRHFLIFNTLRREPHVLCPTTLNQVLCFTPKPKLPAKPTCACYVLACILAQIWMDLAGLALEENQVGTTFSLSLSLTSRRASASFSDMKDAAKKRFTAVEASVSHPTGAAPLCF